MRDKTDMARRAIADGKHAALLLDDPMIVQTIAAMKDAAIHGWITAMEPASRESCWQDYQAALRFEQGLREYMLTGKMAAQSVEES